MPKTPSKRHTHAWKNSYHIVQQGVRVATKQICTICQTFREIPYDQPTKKSSGPTVLGLSSGERVNQ